MLIPNALQPADVEEVILCQMLGRAIVLVQEDQLSLAIGRRGQNVRLASKLCGWDIEIMTREELDEQIEQAVLGYSSIEGVEAGTGRTAGRRRLPLLRRPLGHRAGGPDGDGRADGRSKWTRSCGRPSSKAAEAEKAAAEQRRQQREQERLEAAETAEAAATRVGLLCRRQAGRSHRAGEPRNNRLRASDGRAGRRSSGTPPYARDRTTRRGIVGCCLG